MATPARIQAIRRSEDATERHEGDAILRHLNDFLNAFMWQADPATLRITFVTTTVRDLLGHPVSRWIGAPEEWSANIHPADRERVIDSLRATANDGVDREVEFRVEHADGSLLVLRHAVRRVAPPSGANELWGITTNITSDVRTAETLRETQERYRSLSAQAAEFRRRSLEDPLTKLPNRALFEDRLGAALRNAQRSGSSFAVLLMDLDRFKHVNDTHGHQAGDAVLREVALRLRICLRAQDTPARLGGDEFVALLPGVDVAGAMRVASRFVHAMETPFEVHGARFAIGVSIGIAMFPENGSSPEGLLTDADVAMYRAKKTGGGYVVSTHEGETLPGDRKRSRRNRRRIVSRFVIGLAAGLALVAGALSPMAHSRPTRHESATRLEAATIALQSATENEVVDVVAGVERTLAEISWKDVAGPEVVSALRRLQRILAGLKSGVAPALVERVDRLLGTIQRAELVAKVTGAPKPGTIPSPVPKSEPSATANPRIERSPGEQEPNAVPTILAPSLP